MVRGNGEVLLLLAAPIRAFCRLGQAECLKSLEGLRLNPRINIRLVVLVVAVLARHKGLLGTGSDRLPSLQSLLRKTFLFPSF